MYNISNWEQGAQHLQQFFKKDTADVPVAVEPDAIKDGAAESEPKVRGDEQTAAKRIHRT